MDYACIYTCLYVQQTTKKARNKVCTPSNIMHTGQRNLQQKHLNHSFEVFRVTDSCDQINVFPTRTRKKNWGKENKRNAKKM